MQTINNYSKKFSSVNNIGNFISKIIFYVCIVFFFHKSFIILEIRRNINYNSITNFGDNSKEYIIDENLYWNNQTSLNIDNIIKEIKYFNKEIYFERKTDFEKRENPKISIVITLHNNEINIKSIYASIQKQELKDLEIIFVDDDSKDNTYKIINELMDKDKRIVYLKNDINRRAFYSRNRGILNSTGEYVICIDPDDLLVNNILIKAFETAKKYDLDIVHFYALKGTYEAPKLWKNLKGKGGILKNNSEIRDNFYHCISRSLWDKLVKTNIFKESINYMKKEFYNELYYINNDDTAFFGLLHTARTYGFLEQIGYFYISRPTGAYYYIHQINYNWTIFVFL